MPDSRLCGLGEAHHANPFFFCFDLVSNRAFYSSIGARTQARRQVLAAGGGQKLEGCVKKNRRGEPF